MRGGAEKSRGWRRWTLAFGLVAELLVGGACAPTPGTSSAADPLAEGWTRYRYGEFDAAISAFDAVVTASADDDARRLDGLFGLATTWNLRTPVGDQDKARARQLYTDLLAQAPDGHLAPWCLLALARMKHLVPVGSDPDLPVVRAAYQAVIDRFPEHLAGHEAFLYLQSTYIQTLDPVPTRQAVAALLDFIETHPGSGFLSGAWQLVGAGYETLHEPDRQLAAELRALETMEFDLSNPKQENSGVYWRIAVIAEFEAGDFDTARRFYRRLMDEYPQDIRVFASEEALVRMDRVEADLRQQLEGGGS